MVYRVYVEKRPELANEAAALQNQIVSLLQIPHLEKLRLLNRYDVESIDKALFDACVRTVFSEPQLDLVYNALPTEGATCFAVEYLPGQYDQRADSAAQCIQILTQGDRPLVRTARVYLLYGDLTAEEVARIKRHVINPVESREASLEPCDTLELDYEIPSTVEILDGFRDLDVTELNDFIAEYGLAMDLDDIRCCQQYFRSVSRDPSITEIRMIDTYWSDHCRHTTFNTTIDSVSFADPLLQSTYETYLATRQALGPHQAHHPDGSRHTGGKTSAQEWPVGQAGRI